VKRIRVKTKHNTEKFKVIFNGDLKRIVSWSMDDFDVMKRMEILTCGDGLQNIVKEWEAYCNMVGDYDTDNPQAILLTEAHRSGIIIVMGFGLLCGSYIFALVGGVCKGFSCYYKSS
jgi:hypothetical protein